MANEQHQARRPYVEHGAYVSTQDSLGVIVLAFITLILLLGYMRSQGRNRKLLEKLAKQGQ